MFACAVRGRRAGKTTILVKLAKKNPSSILIVHSDAERARLAREHGLMNIILTYSEATTVNERLRGLDPMMFLIDNLEWYVKYTLRTECHADIVACATGIAL